MSLASRVSDHHICPIALPVPHLVGMVGGPGVTTVLIGSLPAAVEGTTCVCVAGPPNSITTGSTTVKIGNKGAARMGDPTAHGGVVLDGCPTVLIGG